MSRRREERQRQLRTGVRRVATGLTVTGVLADVAEFMV
jgi:hypothetical protein